MHLPPCLQLRLEPFNPLKLGVDLRPLLDNPARLRTVIVQLRVGHKLVQLAQANFQPVFVKMMTVSEFRPISLVSGIYIYIYIRKLRLILRSRALRDVLMNGIAQVGGAPGR